MQLPYLAPDKISPFPPLDNALKDPDGLLCYGGNLSVAQLLLAYRQGIFPWYGVDEPILWWSPSVRAVLFCARFHSSRSLVRCMKRGGYQITRNRAFEAVIHHCARHHLGAAHNWINADMQAAYIQLAKQGYAHSFELWQDGELKGGLYGVVVADVLCAESMFSLQNNASKIILAHLCQSGEFKLIDCQIMSAHLQSLGAECLARADFVALLKG